MLNNVDINDLHKFIYKKWEEYGGTGKVEDTCSFSISACIQEYFKDDLDKINIIKVRQILFDLKLVSTGVMDHEQGYIVAKPTA